MKVTTTSLGSLLLLSLAATSALADDDSSVTAGGVSAEDGPVTVLPCRPTIACTAEIVPTGALEVETGFAQRRATNAPVNSVQALLKYSVSEWLQLQLGSNNVVVGQDGSATQAFDGVYAGPKVVLVRQHGDVPAISVSALFMTPTRGGADAVTKTTDGYFWAYASKDALGFHADLNVGVDVLSMGDKPANQYVAALSVSHDLAGGLGAMAEIYAFEGGGMYAAHDAGVLMALSYAPVPEVMFDLGGDVALHRDSRHGTLFVGVTFVPYRNAPSRHPGARTFTASADVTNAR